MNFRTERYQAAIAARRSELIARLASPEAQASIPALRQELALLGTFSPDRWSADDAEKEAQRLRALPAFAHLPPIQMGAETAELFEGAGQDARVHAVVRALKDPSRLSDRPAAQRDCVDLLSDSAGLERARCFLSEVQSPREREVRLRWPLSAKNNLHWEPAETRRLFASALRVLHAVDHPGEPFAIPGVSHPVVSALVAHLGEELTVVRTVGTPTQLKGTLHWVRDWNPDLEGSGAKLGLSSDLGKPIALADVRRITAGGEPLYMRSVDGRLPTRRFEGISEEVRKLVPFLQTTCEIDTVPGDERYRHRQGLADQTLRGPPPLQVSSSPLIDPSREAYLRLQNHRLKRGATELLDYHMSVLLGLLAERVLTLDIGPKAHGEVVSAALASGCGNKAERFVEMLARNGWPRRPPIENVVRDVVLRSTPEEWRQWLTLAREEAHEVLRARLHQQVVDTALRIDVEALLDPAREGITFEDDERFGSAANDAYYLAEAIFPSQQQIAQIRGAEADVRRLTSTELPSLWEELSGDATAQALFGTTEADDPRQTPDLRAEAHALLGAVEGRSFTGVLDQLDSIVLRSGNLSEASICAMYLAKWLRKLGESPELWTLLARELQPH